MTYDEKMESISEVALADAFRCGYGREQEETVQEALSNAVENHIASRTVIEL